MTGAAVAEIAGQRLGHVLRRAVGGGVDGQIGGGAELHAARLLKPAALVNISWSISPAYPSAGPGGVGVQGGGHRGVVARRGGRGERRRTPQSEDVILAHRRAADGQKRRIRRDLRALVGQSARGVEDVERVAGLKDAAAAVAGVNLEVAAGGQRGRARDVQMVARQRGGRRLGHFDDVAAAGVLRIVAADRDRADAVAGRDVSRRCSGCPAGCNCRPAWRRGLPSRRRSPGRCNRTVPLSMLTSAISRMSLSRVNVWLPGRLKFSRFVPVPPSIEPVTVPPQMLIVSLPGPVLMLPSIRPLVVIVSSPPPVRMANWLPRIVPVLLTTIGRVQVSLPSTPILSPVIVPLLFSVPPVLVNQTLLSRGVPLWFTPGPWIVPALVIVQLLGWAELSRSVTVIPSPPETNTPE